MSRFRRRTTGAARGALGLISLSLASVLVPTNVIAQGSAPPPAPEESRQATGIARPFTWSAIGAPGVYTDYQTGFSFHVGGGFDWRFYERFGVGAEIGIGGAFFALNGFYYLRPEAPRGWAPFLTGGYSVDGGNMVNFGLGANRWGEGRLGLRTGARFHISVGPAAVCRPDEPGCSNWILEFRIGIAIR